MHINIQRNQGPKQAVQHVSISEIEVHLPRFYCKITKRKRIKGLPLFVLAAGNDGGTSRIPTSANDVHRLFVHTTPSVKAEARTSRSFVIPIDQIIDHLMTAHHITTESPIDYTLYSFHLK